MALDATSTSDEILAEYKGNADWYIDNSVTKCKLFIVACEMMLGTRPGQTSVDGTMMAFNQQLVERQLERALAWYRANGGPSGSRVASRRWDMGSIRQ